MKWNTEVWCLELFQGEENFKVFVYVYYKELEIPFSTCVYSIWGNPVIWFKHNFLWFTV